MRDGSYYNSEPKEDANRTLKAFMRWLPPKERLQNELEAAAYARNVDRHVQGIGRRLVVLMVERGFLNREDDPVEILKSILDTIDELEGTPDKSSECGFSSE